MNKLKRILSVLAVILAFAATPSCLDLDEVVYSDIIADNFYQTEEEIISALAPAYGLLRNMINAHIWSRASYATDEYLYPTRGRHWYDGGHYQRFHEHTWTWEQPQLNTAWVH